MTEAEWLNCTNPEAMLAGVYSWSKPRQLPLFACACCRRLRQELADPRLHAVLEAVERQPESWPRTTSEVVEVLADLQAAEAAAVAQLHDAMLANQEARHQAREADVPPAPSGVLRTAVEESTRQATLAAAEAARQAAQALASAFCTRLEVGPLAEALAEAAGLGRTADAWIRCAEVWQRRADQEDDRTPNRGRRSREVRVTIVLRWIEDAEEQERDRIAARQRVWTDQERAAQAGLLRCIGGNPFQALPVVDPLVLAWNDGIVRRLAWAIHDERAFDRMGILADALEEAGCSDKSILAHCRQSGEHARGCWVLEMLRECP
jgi:hypothetical protein